MMPGVCRTMPSSDSSPTMSVSATSAMDLSRGDEDADRNRQVVGRSGFFQVRRGKIDGDVTMRHPSATVTNGRPNSLATFLNRRVGQADDDDSRTSPPTIDLDFDQHAIQANDRATIDLGEHAVSPSTWASGYSPSLDDGHERVRVDMQRELMNRRKRRPLEGHLAEIALISMIASIEREPWR